MKQNPRQIHRAGGKNGERWLHGGRGPLLVGNENDLIQEKVLVERSGSVAF